MLSFLKHTFLEPLAEFIHDSRAIGIILLSCTILSLLLANLPFTATAYVDFWQWHVGAADAHTIQLGLLKLPNSLLLVINDLLMSVFFFLAGMEIKRELVNGELSSFRKSILPIVAAIGGMAMPAVLFAICNKGGIYLKGWAIPTATDIAFTLGVASLLGNRVPVALKVFITALAIIDDLGAVVVIAMFYGSTIALNYLLCCVIIVVLVIVLNRRQVAWGVGHLLLGILLWYGMFNSGIHATVAGVIMAFLVPSNKLSGWELKLHNYVYFLVMPIFALANTAISFSEEALQAVFHSSLSWGIMMGLFIGKPVGICLVCWFLVRKKIAHLPTNTTWRDMIGAGMLAGIGFTMSIFITSLAFEEKQVQDVAKIAVLLASTLAIALGYVWLRFFCKR